VDVCALRGQESDTNILKNIVAIYHNSVSVIKRSAGKSAIAAAAYRSGDKLTDERTGLTHDYRSKSGVDYSVVLTPIEADWIADRQQLWNKVEAAEKRGDAQLAREITVAIPIELSRNNQIALVRDYVQANYVDLGMIADINFHKLDSDNPHAHVMLTMRELKIDERGDVSFGNKNRDWNHKNLLVKNREDWATLANKYLVDAGYPDRQIDHRSNADRGIEIIPQIHLGVAASAMQKKGIKSELGDKYDRIEIVNNNIRQKLEQIYESESATRDLEQQLAEFDRQITPPEIPKIPTVTAKKIDKSQFYEKIEIPKEVAKPPELERRRWTSKKKIDPRLVRSILEIGDRLGTDYQAGNYQIQANVPQSEIRIKYKNNVAMIIYPSTCEALLIDHSFTVEQYQLGLAKSIDALTDSEQQQEQEQAKEQQQRQAEPEQLEQLEQQKEPGLELPHDIVDDSELIVDGPKINVTKPLASKNLSRGGWNR
jgi:MobA/MobL family